MADAIVSMVLEQFTSYAQHKVELVVGVGEEVRKLSFTLRMIREVLQDAEQKQVKNGLVKIWLEELKGVLYDVDDVMDEWNTKMVISQLQRVDLGDDDALVERKKKVFSLLLSLFRRFKEKVKHVHVRYDIGHQIKEIRERLDEINANRSQFGLVTSPSQDQPRVITSSIVDVSTIHGRDQDAKMIVSRLLSESSHQEIGVQVLAVVGMGGFGKTTLVKLVLKEERLVKKFEKIMWVCVSEPFNLFGVAKAIIEQAQGDVPSSTEWEVMHQALCNSVKGKRFLLVLDDVWTKDPSHWNPLKVSLDGGAAGSRIIVTTRNNGVAEMMGSSYIHSVEKLSEGDSWSLLCDVALRGREDHMKFENVGKQIASKCKGVPLALSTLGSLLREKKTLQNWRDISENDIWGLPHMEEFFLPSLFLSYCALPTVSKQCFLYCVVFPKDTDMEKTLLVKLWMAEGFLGSGRMRHLEKVGEECFDNLSMRSFFQDFKKDSNGNVVSCKIHDLVHDFAQYLSLEESSSNAKFDHSKVRYLYWEGIENSLLFKAKKVRTLIGENPKISVELFDMLPCRLRVLDLREMKLEKLPDSVEKLIHLRYLNLNWASNLLELPETICNLFNLQTLNLNYCWKLEKLPKEIGRLSNLRHLEMERTDALKYLPQSVKRLSSLRTLSKFIVGEGWNISGLKQFKNLGGTLELYGLGGISNESDAIEADLKKKKDLRRLSFNWEETDDNAAITGVENLFGRLEPCEDLEELKIRHYPGSQFPRWVHLLGNIVKMKLFECRLITQLPALGRLGSLESLKINGLRSVKLIGREFYGFDTSLGAEMISFPKLKTLILKNMDELENWEVPIFSKDTKIMPLLSSFELKWCSKLKALPPWLGNLESLEELEIRKLDCIQRLDMGTSNDDEEHVLFPKLTDLRIDEMDKLEQWSQKYRANMMMPSLCNLEISRCRNMRVLPDLTKFKSLERLDLRALDSWEEETEERGEQYHHSMPDCFTQLIISNYPKLNEVPSYLFSPTLKQFFIQNCPELSRLQCMPPLLESLWMWGDCGGYSKSIPIAENKQCSITHFYLSSHSSLPEGFKELKALQVLTFISCESLDFELKELAEFTMLQELRIEKCPILEERFQRDDWRSILPHVPAAADYCKYENTNLKKRCLRDLSEQKTGWDANLMLEKSNRSLII